MGLSLSPKYYSLCLVSLSLALPFLFLRPYLCLPLPPARRQPPSGSRLRLPPAWGLPSPLPTIPLP